jgi:hypothetical protein
MDRQAALAEYLRLGWAPCVLCPPDHRGVGEGHLRECVSPGKVPLHRWRQSPAPPAELWSLLRKHPGANLGVTCGSQSGVVGIDVDSDEGWGWLSHQGVDLRADGPRFSTHRGFRLLYRAPEGGLRSQPLYRGVEVLAEGRQTVVPPSLHAKGSVYRWLDGGGPGLPLPPFPLELLDRKDHTASGARDPHVPGRLWGEGSRNTRLFRLACVLRHQGAGLDEVLGCLHVFNRRCVPRLGVAELEAIAGSACAYRPTVQEGRP